MYGVWIQPIDDMTSPENIELYGEVEEYSDMYAAGRVKEFCDGQTSPSGPRFADDRMGMLWTKNRETADFIQGVLRNELAGQISSGLAVSAAPSWLSGAAAASVAPAALAGHVAKLRKDLDLAEEITDSQIETAVKRYVRETGGQIAGAAEWMRENVQWASNG